MTTPDDPAPEAALRRFVDGLPPRFQARVRWLTRPERRRLRVIVAALLIAGGLMWFLPLVGFWMLPLGLFLLAEDLPPVRRWLGRILLRWEEWRARRNASGRGER